MSLRISLTVVSGALESFLLPYLPQLIYTAGTIGCCGVTLTISLFSDLLSVTTAHVQLCYHISRLVYRQQLNIAGSLWHIFRGLSSHRPSTVC